MAGTGFSDTVIPLAKTARQLTAGSGYTRLLRMNELRPPTPPLADASMHDMLRIMDVASALRRERETAEAVLDVATAKQKLRERLLATAAAAGEPVTAAEVDAAIDGVPSASSTSIATRRRVGGGLGQCLGDAPHPAVGRWRAGGRHGRHPAAGVDDGELVLAAAEAAAEDPAEAGGDHAGAEGRVPLPCLSR